MTRDYAAEVAALMEEKTASGTFMPREVAREIVQQLKDEDLHLLLGWVTPLAENWLYETLRTKVRSVRRHVIASAGRQTWADLADVAEKTEDYGLVDRILGPTYSTSWHVPGQGYKCLADLNHEDMKRSADWYHNQGEANFARAAFLRYLDNEVQKAGVEKPSDVFSEDQIAEIMQRMLS